MKKELKEKAIALRRQGLSYSEIMAQVPVAKSTISEWLHSIGLAKHQKQRLTNKKLMAIKRGAEAKHKQRVVNTRIIIENAKNEIGKISQRELWLMGIMLYWAEGSKEKDWDPGCSVQFTNTDPEMIHLFIYWLKEFFHKTLEDITLDLYIHDLQRGRTPEILKFWTTALDCPSKYIRHIYYKKGNPKTLRKNIGAGYHGTLRVTVKCSTNLNRRIAGWTLGVIESTR